MPQIHFKIVLHEESPKDKTDLKPIKLKCIHPYGKTLNRNNFPTLINNFDLPPNASCLAQSPQIFTSRLNLWTKGHSTHICTPKSLLCSYPVATDKLNNKMHLRLIKNIWPQITHQFDQEATDRDCTNFGFVANAHLCLSIFWFNSS